MAGITVQGLLKRFGTNRVVNDVSFQVAPGELVTLLGPSGCGKTTTLRMLAGLEEPDGGEVRLGNRILSSPGTGVFVPPEERAIGMVFQNYAIWPHMTVAENVGFPLRMKKVPARQIPDQVLRILETVGLRELHDRPAMALSGGQQQRVALARALVAKPEILLLDEPFSNLDARLREEVRLELRELQQRLGITTVFVTHDQTEAMALSDRIVVMNAGRIEQEGRPAEVYTQPASRFVLDFLGTANYVSGEVLKTPDGQLRVLVPDAGGAMFPPVSAEGMAQGAAVSISFRPEDVVLEPGDDRSHEWQARVQRVIFLGSYTEYLLLLGSTRIRGVTLSHKPYAVGSTVTVSIPLDALRVWPERDRTVRTEAI